MESISEKQLLEAGEKLGAAMKAVTDEEKTLLQSMYKRFQELVKHQGDTDVSAFFAMAIISNDQITNAELIAAAADYIDKDLAYCRSRQKAE